MSSTEAQEMKYSYKFTFPGKKVTGSESDEPSKNEVQIYINELLGVKKDSGTNNRLE
jgi:hypothetical protein